MNTYQQKWIDVLNNVGLKEWTISASGDDIFIEMPNVTDLKLIRDNLPATLASISLDIDEPKSRLKFIVRNGHEKFEYILNPSGSDLNEGE